MLAGFSDPQAGGGLAGLTPTPYQSGQSRRELGIAKAGNRHIRAMAIEIAWAWRRFHPDSALSQWYERRFGAGNARLRQLGIVALARKLLIALWRFVKTGSAGGGRPENGGAGSLRAEVLCPLWWHRPDRPELGVFSGRRAG